MARGLTRRFLEMAFLVAITLAWAGGSTAQGASLAQRLIDANRAWLAPPLEARRGLAYDYRQEAPYHERIVFDGDGNVMAQLVATSASTSVSARQWAFLAGGTIVRSNPGEPYVAEDKPKEANPQPVRLVNNLATGLAWDCALTALGRSPASFTAEAGAVKDGKLVMTLRSREQVYLFAGTMLAFTSWAYMHDVRYDRAEVVCEAATLRPLEERDYQDGRLAGHFTFSDYREDPSGAAPGRIKGVIPYEKDGKDQALEMDAAFRFVKPGVWLLDRIRSEFHGGVYNSSGQVTPLKPAPGNFAAIEDLLARVKATRQVLATLQAAPEGELVVPFVIDRPQACCVRARGVDAFSSGGRRGELASPPRLIGVHDILVDSNQAGHLHARLNALSSAAGCAYEVIFTVELLDGQGQVVLSRASAPQYLDVVTGIGAFTVDLDLVPKDFVHSVQRVRVRVSDAEFAWGTQWNGGDVYRIKQ